MKIIFMTHIFHIHFASRSLDAKRRRFHVVPVDVLMFNLHVKYHYMLCKYATVVIVFKGVTTP
jgi:hypothetical protein